MPLNSTTPVLSPPKATTTIKTSSDGAWQGENPLHSAVPLLIAQIILVLFISRSLAFLLKPLRQPKVVAEIIGGILLGPSALGRSKGYLHLIFPSWSLPVLESVANIGLLFFLFLVGLELDLSTIRQRGKKAFSIAIAGISLPFLFGIGATFLLRKVVQGEEKVGFGQFLLFIGVSQSITAFPVLARILAELKLLTTHVGQTAMAAAALNDVAAWILLALAVAIAENGSGPDAAHKSSPLVSIWVLMLGVAFVAFMLIVVRPIMNWMARQCSPEHDSLDEAYICVTLAGVMLSGFMTDLIGIHAIFGAFVFGLTIPHGGRFATRLIKAIEDFVSGLLLPLYFASSGLRTDVGKIQGLEAWGLLVLVISTACAGKIMGTFVAAMLCMIPVRESLTLGVLMNTKGLVELIVLNIGKDKRVLNDEMFAILVLMALFTTCMTTPIVMAIYKPRQNVPHTHRRQLPLPQTTKDELRILACIHGPVNVPSLIELIDLTRINTSSPLKLYIMHLVELTSRSSSIMMVQRVRKNGFPFINRFRKGSMHDQVTAAFQAYRNVSQVAIRLSTAISALPTMHEDIQHVAEDKRVGLIILPFHKQYRGESEGSMENVGGGWREVNQRVLKNASCSVAILLDRGLGDDFEQGEELIATPVRRVCILFFGGPDDREGLKIGGRMSEHPAVRLTVLRFMEKVEVDGSSAVPSISEDAVAERPDIATHMANHEMEAELDEAAMAQLRKYHDSTDYVEKHYTSNITEELLKIGQSREYELIIVGRSRLPHTLIGSLANQEIEHPELGPVGNILAQSDKGVVSSVLVIQQHESTSPYEATP